MGYWQSKERPSGSVCRDNPPHTEPPRSAAVRLLHCPNCKSNNLRSSPAPQTTTWRKLSVRFAVKPCCEWSCQNCGTQFPSIQEIDRRIDTRSTATFVFFLFLFFFSFSSIHIFILSLSESCAKSILWVTIPAALLFLFLWLYNKIRLAQLIANRYSLIKQCYS